MSAEIMKKMNASDFDYDLPESLIAQSPTPNRAHSRLLTVPLHDHSHFSHQTFLDFEKHIQPNDMLIFNDTKVIPARLSGQKETGGKVSCLIERIISDDSALAHLRASHAPLIGSTILFENAITAVMIARHDALFELKFLGDVSVLDLLMQYGKIPLPPYIARDAKQSDYDRYQTVYARHLGAVAAPTAGLHFDEAMLERLQKKGVEMGFVTLHVGAGTFQPIRVESLDEHHMHNERVIVSKELCEKIKACKMRGSRVVAVGTTVVRALETAALSGEIQPFFEDSRLFIRPGFQFHCVDALLTNFHLPKSTLLMLVCALGGYERVMSAYAEAIKEKYRFFSYGDAMFLS